MSGRGRRFRVRRRRGCREFRLGRRVLLGGFFESRGRGVGKRILRSSKDKMKYRWGLKDFR